MGKEFFFFFSSRRRHTRCSRDWSSDVCSSDLGGRIKPAEINARFVAYRDAPGLPRELSPHSLRHSYVTHLTEDGADRRFLQEQAGHRCDTSTAIYTHVSGDFMNTALRRALGPALSAPAGGSKEES